MKNHANTDFRFERKFFLENSDRSAVERLILLHPGFFTEIFAERYINNIYFDDQGLSNFQDNINGNTHRKKFRIRWYGDQFTNVEKPVLELKIKRGTVGTKNHYDLAQFVMARSINASLLENLIQNSVTDPYAIESLSAQSPVMVNRYRRKYFISNDKKFRITIDTNQSFYKFNRLDNEFAHVVKDDSNVILELKYRVEDDLEAKMITNKFPYRTTKSSKYARGMELLYF